MAIPNTSHGMARLTLHSPLSLNQAFQALAMFDTDSPLLLSRGRRRGVGQPIAKCSNVVSTEP
jgi:hypothetical protein